MQIDMSLEHASVTYFPLGIRGQAVPGLLPGSLGAAGLNWALSAAANPSAEPGSRV